MLSGINRLNTIAMKTRRTYTPIRIDFTPFVDTAFLLLTFFMLIKTIQKPNQMRVDLPDDNGCFESFPPASATLFLLGNNRIGFLTYQRDGSNAEFLETGYSSEGLRKQLMYLMPDKRTVVLIIPTVQSTYKNLVDVFDELQIHGKIRFRLAYELTSGEKSLLQKYETYKATNPSASKLIRMSLYKGVWDYIADLKRRKV
ncbi:hypothetical protein GCM10028805_38140 [Spirosoma harenae]